MEGTVAKASTENVEVVEFPGRVGDVRSGQVEDEFAVIATWSR